MHAIPFATHAPMLLHRTEKARRELSPGVRTLSLRERSLLLLADGKPLADLQAMYHGIGAQMVEQLVREGYLTHLATTRAADTAAPAPETPPEPTEALRSLAGTRMYLFDLCERLFARRDPRSGPLLSRHLARSTRPPQHAGGGRSADRRGVQGGRR